MSSHLLLSTILALSLQTSLSRPTTYNIDGGKPHCIYEVVQGGEHLTFHVLMNGGNDLSGVATLEGPFGTPEIVSSTELMTEIKRYERGARRAQISGIDSKGNYYHREDVDFEHFSRYSAYDDDDDYDDDDYERDGNGRRRKKKKVRRGNERGSGDPWLKTFHVANSGWYRGCLSGGKYQVSAEMDLRKSSHNGLSHETFHVLTHSEHMLMLTEKEEDKDAAKVQHLDVTHSKIKSLNRIVHQIKEKQKQELSKLEVHMLVTQHSSMTIKWRSLLETSFFVAMMVYQVYTVRNWFHSKSILGM